MIFFAFLTILVHGYPSNVLRDNSAEDLFSTSHLDTFDDGTLVSSLPSGDYNSAGASSSNTLDTDGSIFTSNFLEGSSPAGPPLTNTQTLFGDPVTDSDPSLDIFDPLVASTNYGLEDGASIQNSDTFVSNPNCEDSAIETGGFLAAYDPNQDSSIDMFDQSASVTNAEDSIRTANLKGPGNTIQVRGVGAGQYVAVTRYDLDPNTSPYTQTPEAYAADGTPIRQGNCPAGKKRTCCVWATVPPFSLCWLSPKNTQVCRFAKNQFCCADVTRPGGPGIDCDEPPWVKARDGRKQRETPPQSPTSNQLQETFPILQELPGVNPAYCRPQRRV